MEETRFAFIIHPLDRAHFERVRQVLGREPGSHSVPLGARRSITFSPVHAVTLSFVPGNNSRRKTTCDVMLCPLLPEQMVENEAEAISNILDAIKIAQDRGAQLIGLGGFTSIVGNGGLDIAARTTLPVTSGNTYTAAAVVQSILTTGELLRVNYANSCIAIIGATGDIGSACAKSIVELFGKMILVAKNDQRLEMLASFLRSKCPSVCIEKQASKAAVEADVVITVTSALTTLIGARDLKRNAIVCDISYPANVAKEIRRERPDILVFEGGIVSSQHFVSQIASSSSFWEFNPRYGMHACFVETLLLALEGKFATYSIGRGRISQEKMHEIKGLADEYDFHPVLFWDGVRYDQQRDILNISRARSDLQNHS